MNVPMLTGKTINNDVKLLTAGAQNSTDNKELKSLPKTQTEKLTTSTDTVEIKNKPNTKKRLKTGAKIGALAGGLSSVAGNLMNIGTYKGAMNMIEKGYKLKCAAGLAAGIVIATGILTAVGAGIGTATAKVVDTIQNKRNKD